MGLGNRCAPCGNDSFEKRRRLVLSRHTLWKSLKKSRLEHELGGRGKSRQHGRGGIEDRPSADVAANRAVEHRPRGARPNTPTSLFFAEFSKTKLGRFPVRRP